MSIPVFSNNAAMVLSAFCQDEEIGKNTVFHLNFDYSNKRTKFKIVTAFQKEIQQVRTMKCSLHRGLDSALVSSLCYIRES